MQLKKIKLDSIGQFQTHSKAIVAASYTVSLHVAKTKKIHNICEMYLEALLVSWASVSTCVFLSINCGDSCLPISSVSLANITVHYILQPIVDILEQTELFCRFIDDIVWMSQKTRTPRQKIFFECNLLEWPIRLSRWTAL